MPVYTWLTLQQGIDALSGRLQAGAFWTTAELRYYIIDALRTWSALTEQWNADFTFVTSSAQTWYNTATLAESPRLRTTTDAEIYTLMQYMLLEPPTGAAAWTGTNQFNLAALQYSLQRRRDEVIQATACNITQLAPLPSTPGTRRVLLGDTVLESRRIRFVPDSTLGLPITLTREDAQAFQYFSPDYLQTDALPQSWSVASEPPIAFDVNFAPNVAGIYDVLALQSGPIFAPPVPSPVGIPDDWCWLPMFGALADLLAGESERTDSARAQYCLKRYTDGIKIMRNSNWLVQASVNGVPYDTPSVFEADSFAQEWDSNPNTWPAVVQAGMDFVGIAPAQSSSANLTLVGNAPIPLLLTDYIQASRDQWDAILGYAQRMASFKMGGEDWQKDQPLELDFYRAATMTNKRLLTYGIYTDILHSEGRRQEEEVTR